MSESDVYIRQIVTTKVDPRAVRVKEIPANIDIDPMLIYCWPIVCDTDPSLKQH